MDKPIVTEATNVLSIHFSDRAKKVLSTLLMGLRPPIKYGYATLGDIIRLERSAIKGAKNCGEKTFKEIEDKLSDVGLVLNDTSKKPVIKFTPRIAPPDSSIVVNQFGGKQSELEYRCDLLPPQAILAIAELLKTGAEKYGVDNWKKVIVSDHINHAMVHLLAFLAGDGCDDHLTHAATRLLFALELKVENDNKLPLDDEGT